MKTRSLAAAAITALVFGALIPATAAQAAEVTVTGTVSYGSSPVSDIRVGWFSPSTGESNATYSEQDGTYSLTIPADVSKYYLSLNLYTDDGYSSIDQRTYNGEYIGTNGQDYLYQTRTAWNTPTAAVVNPKLSKPGSITGTSKALAGESLALETLGGGFIDNIEVNSNGSFSGPNLIPGRYLLESFGAKGYLPFTTKSIVVAPGKATTVSLAPSKGATIKGVVKSAGKIVKGVDVYAMGTYEQNQAKTDSKGAYTISGLKGGKYDLWIGSGYNSNYVQKSLKVSGVKVGSPKTVNVTLAKGSKITGTVKLTSGAKSFQVTALNSKKQHVNSVYVSSKSKKFSIGSLPGGKYTLEVTDSNGKKYGSKSVTVKAGKSKSAGKIKLTKKLVTLSGVVPGAKSGNVSVGSSGGSYYSDSAISSKGTYKVTGIVPGKLIIGIYAQGFANKTVNISVKKSTKKNLSKGAALGKVTGRIQIGGVDVEYANGDLLKGSNYVGFLDAEDGKFEEYLPSGTITIDSFDINDDQFQYGAPFYYDLPSAKKSFKISAGKTTALGTFNLELKR